MQMVGQTGWQLSQGERSHVFLTRALLQRPELMLLGESFSALDPENLRQSLECVMRRAETLMVLAHP
jgi:ABC-type molybdenum transport system ATPase subunit/photorepair protein PhrA